MNKGEAQSASPLSLDVAHRSLVPSRGVIISLGQQGEDLSVDPQCTQDDRTRKRGQ